MRILAIAASNMINMGRQQGTSYQICSHITAAVQSAYEDSAVHIIELKECHLQPCTGCGECLATRRCGQTDDFNPLYEAVIACDRLFIVSPHYAPVPAKLSMLLEKMEQISFLPWGKDNTYRSEVYGIPTGVISHGGGADWALRSYQRMVNDTIANALETIQLQMVPYNQDWQTGISLPVQAVDYQGDSPFPRQAYDWSRLAATVADYTARVLSAKPGSR